MKRLYRMAHTSFSFSFPLVLVEPGLLPHKHVAITSPVLAVAAHRTLGTSGAIETRFTMMLLDDDNDNVDDDVWHDNTDCSFLCARAIRCRSSNARSVQAPKCTRECACVLFLHRSDDCDDDVEEDCARGNGGVRRSPTRHKWQIVIRKTENTRLSPRVARNTLMCRELCNRPAT